MNYKIPLKIVVSMSAGENAGHIHYVKLSKDELQKQIKEAINSSCKILIDLINEELPITAEQTEVVVKILSVKLK
jgi:hypothetical protein